MPDREDMQDLERELERLYAAMPDAAFVDELEQQLLAQAGSHTGAAPDSLLAKLQQMWGNLSRVRAGASAAIAIVAIVVLVGVLQVLLRGAAGRGDGPGPAPDAPEVALLQTEQQPEDELPERLARGEGDIDLSTARFLGEYRSQRARERYWGATSNAGDICIVGLVEGLESDWWVSGTGCDSAEGFNRDGVTVSIETGQYAASAAFVPDGYAEREGVREQYPEALIMDNLLVFDAVPPTAGPMPTPNAQIFQTEQQERDELPEDLARSNEQRVDLSTTRFLGEHTSESTRERYWGARGMSGDVCLIGLVEGRDAGWRTSSGRPCTSVADFNQTGISNTIEGTNIWSGQYAASAAFVPDGYTEREHVQEQYPDAIVLDNLIIFDTEPTSEPWTPGGEVWTPEPTPASTQTAPPEQTGVIDRIPSPAGDWTALVNRTAGSLTLEGPGDTTTAVLPAGAPIEPVTWSPDGRNLLAVRTDWENPAGTGAGQQPGIWRVPVDNDAVGEPVHMFPPEDERDEERGSAPSQITFGRWSPDSRFILFWRGMRSASLAADGNTPYVLDVENDRLVQPADTALINERYYSWAPDSSSLAITVGGGRSAQDNKWLNLVDLASGEVTTVVSKTEQIPGIVAWSPTGDTIAYAAVPVEARPSDDNCCPFTFANPAIAARRIYLLDPQTGDYRRLNDAAAYQDTPTWSADGETLYYVQKDGDELMLMAADPETGEVESIEASRQPVPESVGSNGQSEWHELIEIPPDTGE